jgi:SAM-dependent methyltransferase
MLANAHYPSGQKQDWQDLGSLDPLWAILADDEKKFGLWDLDEFFETGAREIESVLATAKVLNVPTHYRDALDFGCGVGRLSRAIRRQFESCLGVDISPAMIDLARRLNSDCKFEVIDEHGMSTLGDAQFDFVYSNIVLQHQRSASVVFAYLAEFMRVLRPGGLLAFQLPHHIPLRLRLELRRRLYRVSRNLFRLSPAFIYKKLNLNPISMLAIPEAAVVQTVTNSQGVVLEVRHDKFGGPRVESRTYFVTKSVSK